MTPRGKFKSKQHFAHKMVTCGHAYELQLKVSKGHNVDIRKGVLRFRCQLLQFVFGL